MNTLQAAISQLRGLREMAIRTLSGAAALCAIVGTATAPAYAQTAKPVDDGKGVRLGAFMLYPELVAGATFDNNVFATKTNEQNDTIYTLEPSARLQSNWSNHSLILRASALSRSYADNGSQDTTDVNLGAYGRLDVTRRARLFASTDWKDSHEQLFEAPTLGLREPVEYKQSVSQIGGEVEFNRLKFTGTVGYDSLDFEDGRLFNGAVVDQDDRDRDITTYGVRADYALGGGTALFVSASHNEREFDKRPPAVATNRDSDGYEVLAGAAFDITRLLRGDFGVGYFSQSFDQPGVSDEEGFAVRGNLRWVPTQLLTISADAERSVGDSGLVGTRSTIITRAGVTADYAWRSNISLNGGLNYTQEDYSGVSRTDDRVTAFVGAEYKVNRIVSLTTSLTQTSQSSDSTFGREYDKTAFFIGVKFAR